MALYHRFHGNFPDNGEDHTDYNAKVAADEVLFIPHIEEQMATLNQVKQVFSTQNIGTVTTATFIEKPVPATYKGKNKKKVFSATVYVQWHDSPAVTQLREDILRGDKETSRITVDEDANTYWVLRPNSFEAATLLQEQACLAQLEDTALHAVFACI
jgi:hypothetical protein